MCCVETYLRVRRVVMVDGMSIREASLVFGPDRDILRKMLAVSVSPGCLRQTPSRHPEVGGP